MKQITLLLVITSVLFVMFGLTLLLGIIKRNLRLVYLSLVMFFSFSVMAVWTGFTIARKSYAKVAELGKPRTGDEIYDALFNTREYNCVKVLHHQDQTIPKIDYAIWLEFETCPEELRRILSRHQFSANKISTHTDSNTISPDPNPGWFRPALLGDSVMFYQWSTPDNGNIQMLWVSPDNTRVFCEDIAD